MSMTSLKDFRSEALKNPDVKAAYDALEEEYALARALIQAHHLSGLSIRCQEDTENNVTVCTCAQ